MAFWQLVGLVLVGVLVANVVKLVLAQHVEETIFRCRTDMVSHELERFGSRIPNGLQKRMQRYFQYRFSCGDHAPLQMLDSSLMPRGLRTEIAMSLYKDTITKVPFLRKAHHGILTRICLALQVEIHMPADF